MRGSAAFYRNPPGDRSDRTSTLRAGMVVYIVEWMSGMIPVHCTKYGVHLQV